MNRLFSSSATLRSQTSKNIIMSLQKVTHCVFDMDGLLLGKLFDLITKYIKHLTKICFYYITIF